MDPFIAAAAAAGPWAALFGLLLAGLYGLLRGSLVSGAQLDRLTEQWEARLTALTEHYESRIAESHQREQDWRTAYERTDERADVQGEQVAELLTYARAADAVLRALPTPGGAPRVVAPDAPTLPRGFPRPGGTDA